MTASESRSGSDSVTRIRRLVQGHPNCALALVTVAMLIPFVSKPLNMDDALFVWAAKQIHAHPANPYGFEVNWYGTVMPMSEVTMNPPLTSYYLALAANIVGWSEASLHLACLVPAVAVVLGTYRLARHLCQRPQFASALTLSTPGFLVSSTTVMCDVMMLAFWIWAIVFWVEGMSANSRWRLLFAGMLMALATLTKYFGFTVVPLLLAYGLLRVRRSGFWVAALLIPVGVLLAYHWATSLLYGRELLGDAVKYVTLAKSPAEFLNLKVTTSLAALTFTGGCVAVVVFFLPLLWQRRTLVLFLGVGLLVACVGGVLSGNYFNAYGPFTGSSRGLVQAQALFWIIGGVSVLALAIADVAHHRDCNSCLLLLWVFGTFLFAALVNWTVNGRTILPLIPAVGILVARRLQVVTAVRLKPKAWAERIALAAGAVLALVVTVAEWSWAKAVRETARQTCSAYGRDLWYQGHWGFQFYMEEAGAKALDVKRTALQRGALIALPENNTNVRHLKPELVIQRDAFISQGPRFVATMRAEVGAGFHASICGPLPFAFGLAPPERVVVIECVQEP